MSEVHMPKDDEIDLIELFHVLWKKKTLISIITSTGAVLSVLFSLMLPNIFQSEALLAPVSSDETGGLSELANQFGGIAGLVGINIQDDEENRTDLAIAVLKSRKFAREFVSRHKIMPQLMAADYWDKKLGELVINEDIYDEKTKSWVVEEPSPRKVFEAYSDALIIEKYLADDFVGDDFITVGFRHLSPDIAKQWTDWAIEDLNNAVRAKDVAEAEGMIVYLKDQVQQTSLAELHNVFYALIQKQTETKMLAQVREEYVFETIDPAVVPEIKSTPRRFLIFVIAFILSGMLASVYVLGNHYIRPSKL